MKSLSLSVHEARSLASDVLVIPAVLFISFWLWANSCDVRYCKDKNFIANCAVLSPLAAGSRSKWAKRTKGTHSGPALLPRFRGDTTLARQNAVHSTCLPDVASTRCSITPQSINVHNSGNAQSRIRHNKTVLVNLVRHKLCQSSIWQRKEAGEEAQYARQKVRHLLIIPFWGDSNPFSVLSL